MAPTIRVDEDVIRHLKRHAEPLVDSANGVLRRLLGLDSSSAECGGEENALTPEELFDNGERVLLIRINKRYRPDMSADELYEATRSAWKMGPKRDEPDFACPVFQGTIKEAYEIDGWQEVPDRGRWKFVGRRANGSIGRYVGQRVKFRRGDANPIRYVNC